MRLAIRVLVGLVLLVVVAAVAIAVMLPRYVNSDAMHEILREQSIALIGRPLQHEGLTLGIIPPRVEVIRPGLAGAHEGREDLLRAEMISLRIGLLPLLVGQVVLESIDVDGLRINLVRTPEGLELPAPSEGADAEPPEPAPVEEVAAEEGEGAPISVFLRRVSVRAAAVTLLDTTLAPPLTHVVESIDLEARGGLVDRKVKIKGDGQIRGGGQLEISGHASLDGAMDLVLTLDGVELSDVAAYLDPAWTLEATLAGDITAKGSAEGIDAVSADLMLSARQLELAGARVSGPIGVSATLGGDFAQPAGKLSLDLTEAEVAQGDILDKAPGVELSARGTYRIPRDAPVVVSIERFAFHSLEARIDAEVGDTTRVRVSAPDFDLEGWEQSVRPLAGLRLRGPVSLEDLSVQLSPLDIRGGVVVDLLVGLPDGGDVSAKGRVDGLGDSIQSKGLDLSVADQHVLLDARLSRLESDVFFEVDVASAGVLRVNPIVNTLSGHDQLVQGPLVVNADIVGSLLPEEGSGGLYQTLVGDVELHLGQGAGDGKEGGRIKGFSVIKELTERLEKLDSQSALTAGLTKSSTAELEQHTTDEFERLDFDGTISDGALRLEQARILYRSYALDLTGDMKLESTELDMKGNVELGAGLMSAFGIDEKDGPLSLALADVTGTVSAPEVSVSEDAAQALVSQVLLRNSKVKEVVGGISDEAEKVVPGAGDLIGKGLEGLFGGGGSKKAKE